MGEGGCVGEGRNLCGFFFWGGGGGLCRGGKGIWCGFFFLGGGRFCVGEGRFDVLLCRGGKGNHVFERGGGGRFVPVGGYEHRT